MIVLGEEPSQVRVAIAVLRFNFSEQIVDFVIGQTGKPIEQRAKTLGSQDEGAGDYPAVVAVQLNGQSTHVDRFATRIHDGALRLGER